MCLVKNKKICNVWKIYKRYFSNSNNKWYLYDKIATYANYACLSNLIKLTAIKTLHVQIFFRLCFYLPAIKERDREISDRQEFCYSLMNKPCCSFFFIKKNTQLKPKNERSICELKHILSLLKCIARNCIILCPAIMSLKLYYIEIITI